MDGVAGGIFAGQADRAGVDAAFAVEVLKLDFSAVGILDVQVLPVACGHHVACITGLAVDDLLHPKVLALTDLDKVFLPRFEVLRGSVGEDELLVHGVFLELAWGYGVSVVLARH